MNIKDFFYNGGIVKCVDRTESDVVIEMCRETGLDIYPYHDPDGEFHGAYWEDDIRKITFYRNGSSSWERGTPFSEWLSLFSLPNVDINDLI